MESAVNSFVGDNDLTLGGAASGNLQLELQQI